MILFMQLLHNIKFFSLNFKKISLPMNKWLYTLYLMRQLIRLKLTLNTLLVVKFYGLILLLFSMISMELSMKYICTF